MTLTASTNHARRTHGGRPVAMAEEPPFQPRPHSPPSVPAPQEGVGVKLRVQTRKPSLYKVLLLNDDYTPMDFVVLVLEKFFNKTPEEATDLMLHVHRKGMAVCGIYTHEVAEMKVIQVTDFSRANEQPLQCTMEKE